MSTTLDHNFCICKKYVQTGLLSLSFPDNAVLTLCYTIEVISRRCMYTFYTYTILCEGHEYPQITSTRIQYTDRCTAHCYVVWVIIKSIPFLHREMSYVYILGVDCVSETFVTGTNTNPVRSNLRERKGSSVIFVLP